MDRKPISRRRFIATSAVGAGLAAGAAYMARPEWGSVAAEGGGEVGIAPSSKHPGVSTELTVSDPANIRLLQFTDLHFFNPKHYRANDPRTIELLPRLVEAAQPDLIAVTGDFWHENDDHRGAEHQARSIEYIEALGLPWLFTWGNHDTLDDYAAGHDALTEARHALYRGGPSGGNYTVVLKDSSGKPVWKIICLNTNRLGMQQAQRDWLAALAAERAGRTDLPPALAAFHIPLSQYKTIWDDKRASGVQLEEVCLEQEDGSSIAALKALGTVRACICGHDHVNDYSGVCEGIELIYGRATGYSGYGGDTVIKGAKLYTLDGERQTYTWQTVHAGGMRWRPVPGTRVDDPAETPWARFSAEVGKA